MSNASTYEALSLSALAAADLSAKVGYAVAVDSSGAYALPTVAGQKVEGLLVDANIAGQQCSAGVLGVFPGKLGGTVAIGDKLCADVGGKLVVASGVPGAWIVGTARQAGVVDDTIEVLVNAGAGGAPQSVQTLAFLLDATELGTNALKNIVTGYPLPMTGRISAIRAFINRSLTVSGITTINAELGGTDVTGGAVTISGNPTVGSVVSGTAVTAASGFAAGTLLDIESTPTATFAADAGMLTIMVDIIPN